MRTIVKLDDTGISPYPWKVDSTRHGLTIRTADGEYATGDTGEFPNVNDAYMASAAPALYGCLKHAIQEECVDCENCSHDGKYTCNLEDGGCFVMQWRDALNSALAKD